MYHIKTLSGPNTLPAEARKTDFAQHLQETVIHIGTLLIR